LEPLVGLCVAENLDPLGYAGGQLLGLFEVGINGDQQDREGVVPQDRPDGLAELLAVALQRGDDDGDILRVELWVLRNGNWLVGPVGNAIDD
jgi:hypothetical protein